MEGGNEEQRVHEVSLREGEWEKKKKKAWETQLQLKEQTWILSFMELIFYLQQEDDKY